MTADSAANSSKYRQIKAHAASEIQVDEDSTTKCIENFMAVSASVPESENSYLEDELMQTPNALKQKQPTSEGRPLKSSSLFSPRAIIGAAPDGLKYVSEMESGLLLFTTRKEIVRLLGSWLIEKFSPDECKPPFHAKIKRAKALIEEFPLLRDSDRAEFEAWYSPAKGKKEATGYIEYGIKNVRRRALKKAPVIKTFSPASSLESSFVEDLAGDKDGEDVLEKKEWLKYNTEPIKLVDNYMAATAKHRCQWIRENTDIPDRF
ncbi:uncharacterized protein LOC117111807 [Anneissia japonica]|uniref:uncharacterized protein LOC117111807 n=1 Tax=Anneissia japonica TaxID=1529436 RepID=UPI00142558AA|nr:uncharacterized protein LOC117111807 [Anneissia japonica]